MWHEADLEMHRHVAKSLGLPVERLRGLLVLAESVAGLAMDLGHFLTVAEAEPERIEDFTGVAHLSEPSLLLLYAALESGDIVKIWEAEGLKPVSSVHRLAQIWEENSLWFAYAEALLHNWRLRIESSPSGVDRSRYLEFLTRLELSSEIDL